MPARRSSDPTRRAALVATAVAVPVVVVLLVLIRLLGPGSGDDGPGDGPVADVSGATPSQRDDSPVQVDTPEITPEADAACPALMSQLPLEVAGETSRRVDSDSPYVYAWGDPASVLVCGVPAIDLAPDALVVTITGLPWFVDTSVPDVITWTTLDRSVAVQITLPASSDSALVTALGPTIAGAVPAR
ncbi:DUF3515 family protein [Klenkia taihuensis]|uniref:DUF3515 domain-containing protein n=1 Tax=Klenkia taihuensis TaxID=1225127 RepID=A0A1I1KNF0_9ACTN|nr:DUF3515 family protein [Klenkia taihuensis]GHE10173.1 hypothetical protein GCM10011381_18010 [Klenkia taihuensis]SFC62454.1 Protein of unknown function [Klenkia taihuensis]